MSLDIFGRIHSPMHMDNLRSLESEVSAAVRDAGFCVLFEERIPYPDGIKQMLEGREFHVDGTGCLRFMLLERPIDTVSSGLVHDTLFENAESPFENFIAFVKKLVLFVNSSFENGAAVVELVTSDGFSIQSDFLFVTVDLKDLEEKLIELLRDEICFFPSLWITCTKAAVT
jgi:hypothetical protein